MKQDRAITALGWMTVLIALLMLSVGRFIMGGIVLLIAFGIFWNRGGGKFNDRSNYEKVVKTDMSVGELFGKIKDIETPLGKAWIAEHKGFSGDSIVFGPTKFKDCVVISRYKDSLDIKHITLLENIIRSSEDEYRFEDLADTSEINVTPENYSAFAGLQMASVMLIRQLRELIEKLDADRNAEVPECFETFRYYYHNSSEGCFRDVDGNDVLKVTNSYYPFVAKVLDMDGNEMASAVPRAFNKKGIVTDSAGYEIMADGEHFGDMRMFKEKGREGFIADTGSGEFVISIFPACYRAKLSCNYIIEKNGKLMAVIGGSPNLLFDSCGRCQNDIILSYDDDYMVLYAILEVFIITLNRKFLK